MTHGSGAPASDVVRLALRYRPSADVLLAQVTERVGEGTPEAVQRDTPDADTTLEWVRRPDGVRHLVGLQMLFASARAAEGRLSPSLPDDLDSRLRPVVRALAGEVTPTDPTLRSDLELDVPVAELNLPDDLLPPEGGAFSVSPVVAHALAVDLRAACDDSSSDAVDRPDTGGLHTEVGAALADLADAIAAAPDADPSPTDRLVAALEDLGATIAGSDGLTAPGCSAAARLALRGGTPLTAGERTSLADLLHRLDNPHQWAEATGDLRELTMRLRGKGRR